MVGLQNTKKIMIIVIMINLDDYFPMDHAKGCGLFMLCWRKVFSQVYSVMFIQRAPTPPKKPRKPNTTGPKSTENPNPKNSI